MTVINSNISALNAQSSLANNQVKLSTAMERLSTGIRINSAKDDAAGLAISNRMTTDIRGFGVAMRNANDGISLTQTAEGHLGQITDNLQRIRELAVQSANASNNADNRVTLNLEASQLVAEIDRIAKNSSFNNIKLLDGSFTAKQFQIGANNSGSDQLTLGIANASSGALGVSAGTSYSTTVAGVAVGSTALLAGALSINGYAVGAAATDGVSNTGATSSGIAVATAINAVSGSTGVNAKVAATSLAGSSATLSGFATAIVAGDVKINGKDIGAIAAAGDAAARGAQVAAAVNAVSAETGVTATFSTTTGAVALNAADGRNIQVQATDAGGKVTTTGLGRGTAATLAGGSALASTAAIDADTISINGVNIGAIASGTTVTLKGDNVAAAINAKTGLHGVTATNTAGVVSLASSGSIAVVTDVIQDRTGLNATLGVGSSAVAYGTSAVESVLRSVVTLTSSESAGITLGGITAAALTASGFSQGYTAAGAAVSGLNLGSTGGAQAALVSLDAAITSVNQSRASLGAYQNRLQFAVSNLQIGSDNLSAARSRILDTDYGAETTNLAKSQIIAQAATAMLAQANQQPQTVLALLK